MNITSMSDIISVSECVDLCMCVFSYYYYYIDRKRNRGVRHDEGRRIENKEERKHKRKCNYVSEYM